LLGPAVAAASLVGVALLTGVALTIPSVIAVTLAYLCALLAVERFVFPGDFRFYAGLRPARRAASPSSA
jgi:hypothetical protein